MDEIQEQIETAVRAVTNEETVVELTRPDEKFGDYSTNIALQLAKKLGQKPHYIAQKIVKELAKNEEFKKVDVAGPGFINIFLSDKSLVASLQHQQISKANNQNVVVEYSDPNPFKELHVGHLYDGVLGESIAKIYEEAGAKVVRVNFGGDVGLHVAKTLWGVLKKLDGLNLKKLQELAREDQIRWMADAYVDGTSAYDNDESSQKEIIEINKKVYALHQKNDHNSDFAQIYWTCRKHSYDYFNHFYERIGTKFDKYYPESQTAPLGIKAVLEQLDKGVFKRSNEAVIYEPKNKKLHTRVFINSNNLPTYEAKDIGLALCKKRDYDFDRNIILTGNEITEYMKVVLDALNQFEPDIAQKTTHLPHGMVKPVGGGKMSSRKGNIVRAVDVLDQAKVAAEKEHGRGDESIAQAAVKYAFLKNRIGGDIYFDIEESVSLKGNSGPYIQYAHARAKSILAKSDKTPTGLSNIDDSEHGLLRKITRQREAIEQALYELAPHHICNYLYELAQEFNRFYEKTKVVGSDREEQRLSLVSAYADTLKRGLRLLNIDAPEKM